MKRNLTNAQTLNQKDEFKLRSNGFFEPCDEQEASDSLTLFYNSDIKDSFSVSNSLISRNAMLSLENKKRVSRKLFGSSEKNTCNSPKSISPISDDSEFCLINASRNLFGESSARELFSSEVPAIANIEFSNGSEINMPDLKDSSTSFNQNSPKGRSDISSIPTTPEMPTLSPVRKALYVNTNEDKIATLCKSVQQQRFAEVSPVSKTICANVNLDYTRILSKSMQPTVYLCRLPDQFIKDSQTPSKKRRQSISEINLLPSNKKSQSTQYPSESKSLISGDSYHEFSPECTTVDGFRFCQFLTSHEANKHVSKSESLPNTTSIARQEINVSGQDYNDSNYNSESNYSISDSNEISQSFESEVWQYTNLSNEGQSEKLADVVKVAISSTTDDILMKGLDIDVSHLKEVCPSFMAIANNSGLLEIKNYSKPLPSTIFKTETTCSKSRNRALSSSSASSISTSSSSSSSNSSDECGSENCNIQQKSGRQSGNRFKKEFVKKVFDFGLQEINKNSEALEVQEAIFRIEPASVSTGICKTFSLYLSSSSESSSDSDNDYPEELDSMKTFPDTLFLGEEELHLVQSFLNNRSMSECAKVLAVKKIQLNKVVPIDSWPDGNPQCIEPDILHGGKVSASSVLKKADIQQNDEETDLAEKESLEKESIEKKALIQLPSLDKSEKSTALKLKPRQPKRKIQQASEAINKIRKHSFDNYPKMAMPDTNEMVETIDIVSKCNSDETVEVDVALALNSDETLKVIDMAPKIDFYPDKIIETIDISSEEKTFVEETFRVKCGNKLLSTPKTLASKLQKVEAVIPNKRERRNTRVPLRFLDSVQFDEQEWNEDSLPQQRKRKLVQNAQYKVKLPKQDNSHDTESQVKKSKKQVDAVVDLGNSNCSTSSSSTLSTPFCKCDANIVLVSKEQCKCSHYHKSNTKTITAVESTHASDNDIVFLASIKTPLEGSGPNLESTESCERVSTTTGEIDFTLKRATSCRIKNRQDQIPRKPVVRLNTLDLNANSVRASIKSLELSIESTSSDSLKSIKEMSRRREVNLHCLELQKELEQVMGINLKVSRSTLLHLAKDIVQKLQDQEQEKILYKTLLQKRNLLLLKSLKDKLRDGIHPDLKTAVMKHISNHQMKYPRQQCKYLAASSNISSESDLEDSEVEELQGFSPPSQGMGVNLAKVKEESSVQMDFEIEELQQSPADDKDIFRDNKEVLNNYSFEEKNVGSTENANDALDTEITMEMESNKTEITLNSEKSEIAMESEKDEEMEILEMSNNASAKSVPEVIDLSSDEDTPAETSGFIMPRNRKFIGMLSVLYSFQKNPTKRGNTSTSSSQALSTKKRPVFLIDQDTLKSLATFSRGSMNIVRKTAIVKPMQSQPRAEQPVDGSVDAMPSTSNLTNESQGYSGIGHFAQRVVRQRDLASDLREQKSVALPSVGGITDMSCNETECNIAPATKKSATVRHMIATTTKKMTVGAHSASTIKVFPTVGDSGSSTTKKEPDIITIDSDDSSDKQEETN